jgi:hypothetical protein
MDEIAKMLPILQQFGISPENLGPERLEKLMSIASLIKNPSDITQEMSRQILDTLGVVPVAPKIQKKSTAVKIGRNSPCACGSGKKYKKCCDKNNSENQTT